MTLDDEKIERDERVDEQCYRGIALLGTPTVRPT